MFFPVRYYGFVFSLLHLESQFKLSISLHMNKTICQATFNVRFSHYKVIEPYISFAVWEKQFLLFSFITSTMHSQSISKLNYVTFSTSYLHFVHANLKLGVSRQHGQMYVYMQVCKVYLLNINTAQVEVYEAIHTCKHT